MEKITKFHNRNKKNCLACSESLQRQNHSFEKFCERTSVHGMKHLGDHRKTVAERFWWCIVIIISCCFCTKLIWNSYTKWENYAIVTTFARTQTNIWDIPFPAITVCPEIKTERSTFSYKNAAFKLSKNISLTKKQQKYFDHLSLICNGRESKATTFENRQEVYENLKKMAPKLSRTMRMIKILGEFRRKNQQYFTPIITNEGVCFSFNILDGNDLFYYPIAGFGEVNKISQWTIEDGYNDTDEYDEYDYYDEDYEDDDETESDESDSSESNTNRTYYEYVYDFENMTYPYRTGNAGANGGITIMLLSFREDIDYSCNSFVQGYKVAIHNPGEVPRIREKFIRVSLDEYVTAAVTPTMTTTSKTLKGYDPNIRKCLFQKDKPLSLYKTYSLDNCINECLYNFTEAICGCMQFYMPGRNSTPICGPRSQDCVQKVTDYVLHEKAIKLKQNISVDHKCDCRPSCVSLDFDVELSRAKTDWKEMFKLQEKRNKYPPGYVELAIKQSYISFLELYMKKEQFMALDRHELYESADFWANCGGLLGLCMGVSIFSVLEIIYFCILRILYLFAGNSKEQTSEGDSSELTECKATK